MKQIPNEIRGDYDLLCSNFIWDLENIMLAFRIIAIYKQPRDYPDKFVARVYDIAAGKVGTTRYIMLDDSLEGLRKRIPQHLNRVEPSTDDEAELEECWI